MERFHSKALSVVIYVTIGLYPAMMTSSNGNIFRVIGHLFWEFTGHQCKGQWRGALNKRLSKQSWNWWFEAHCAHYDVTVMGGVTKPIFSIPLPFFSIVKTLFTFQTSRPYLTGVVTPVKYEFD